MATTAGEVLLAYLGQQLAELRRHAPGVLAKRDEDVHLMRVAARRLRALLASGRPLFTDNAAEPVRAELRWLSVLLGAARDPAVVHERLAALLAQEPGSLGGISGPPVDPIWQRIDEELNAAASAGYEAAFEALGSARYALLLDALDQLLAGAPLTPEAAGPPAQRIGKLMAKDERRLRRAVAGLPVADDGGGTRRDAGLHEVRKAAKRLRYSAELAASLPKALRGPAGSGKGKKRHRHAKRTAKSARRIQQLLGLHQDSVVARELLVELAGRAQERGEGGFSYGRLHAKEEILAAASERDFLKLWKSLRRAR